MNKTLEKVTKDPKRREQGKKSHETYMKRLKEKIQEDNQLPTPSPTDRPTPSTSSSTGKSTPSTPSHASRSSDTYVYGIDILAVLAIGACVFFAYNTSQAEKKFSSMENRINHQNDVICFRKIYNKMSSFDWKKNIEDSIKDGWVITATTTRIFFAQKAANVKSPKASLDAMDIMKLTRGICGVKD